MALSLATVATRVAAERADGALARAAGRRRRPASDRGWRWSRRWGWRSAPPANWFLQTISTRVQRRFRDKVTIALEAHVARLQASIVSVAHQERPEYLDRLSMLRNQVFVLDHMYMSLFTTLAWLLRLAFTLALLAWVHPALLLLAVFAAPSAVAAFWRPDVENKTYERGAPDQRLSLHLFDLATTAAPGKEVRVLGIGERLVQRAPRGLGALVPADGAGALGHGDVERAVVGDLRRRLRRRGGVRRVGHAGHHRAGAAGAGAPARAWPPTSAPRSARSASCADSGPTARAGWPGSRTTRRSRRPPGELAVAVGLARGHPLRSRLVRLSRRVAAGARRGLLHAAGRAPSSPSSARTAPARRRS